MRRGDTVRIQNGTVEPLLRPYDWQNATDGKMNTFATTYDNPKAFIRFELAGDPGDVDLVMVGNRQDCCKERIVGSSMAGFVRGPTTSVWQPSSMPTSVSSVSGR